MRINPDRNRRVLLRTASDALRAFGSGLAAALLRGRHR
jgi:hypothetical protein